MESLRSLRGFDVVFSFLLLCRMNQWDTFLRAALGFCIWICPTQRSPTGLCDSCPGNAVAVRRKCGLTCDFRLALKACFSSPGWHCVYYLYHSEILSSRLWLILVDFRDNSPSSAPNHGGHDKGTAAFRSPSPCLCCPSWAGTAGHWPSVSARNFATFVAVYPVAWDRPSWLSPSLPGLWSLTSNFLSSVWDLSVTELQPACSPDCCPGSRHPTSPWEATASASLLCWVLTGAWRLFSLAIAYLVRDRKRTSGRVLSLHTFFLSACSLCFLWEDWLGTVSGPREMLRCDVGRTLLKQLWKTECLLETISFWNPLKMNNKTCGKLKQKKILGDNFLSFLICLPRMGKPQVLAAHFRFSQLANPSFRNSSRR